MPSLTVVRARTIRALLAVALLAATGCAQSFDATTLGVPVSMASDVKAPAAGAHFSVRATQLWTLWGLLSVSEPSLQRVLAAELVGGKSVADVKIRTHTRITDLLITLVSGGLLVPRAVQFEGTIVGDATIPPPTAPPPAKP